MREIKFRAWSKINHEMFTVIMLAFPFGENRVIVSGRGGSTDTGDDDCVLMQLTGVKDTNGKEIYEGDILKRNNSPCYKVLFADGSYRMNGKSKDGSFEFKINQDKAGLMEVIGNVYEHPDLLKGK